MKWKMKIEVFDDSIGKPLNLSEDFRMFGVEFIKDARVDREQIVESLKVFRDDINHAMNVSKEHYEIREESISNNTFSPKTGKLIGTKRNIDNYFDIFTKLPFLYLDLKRDCMFQYPYLRSPSGGFAGGHGRTLINYRYFPQVTNDVIHQHQDLGFGGVEVIDEVINFVSNNKYWVGKNIDVALVGLKQLKGVWFIKHIDFISNDYLNNHANFRPEYFVEMACNVDLWKRQKKSIDFQKNLLDILDSLVLDNLDYVESIYDWKI